MEVFLSDLIDNCHVKSDGIRTRFHFHLLERFEQVEVTVIGEHGIGVIECDDNNRSTGPILNRSMRLSHVREWESRLVSLKGEEGRCEENPMVGLAARAVKISEEGAMYES